MSSSSTHSFPNSWFRPYVFSHIFDLINTWNFLIYSSIHISIKFKIFFWINCNFHVEKISSGTSEINQSKWFAVKIVLLLGTTRIFFVKFNCSIWCEDLELPSAKIILSFINSLWWFNAQQNNLTWLLYFYIYFNAMCESNETTVLVWEVVNPTVTNTINIISFQWTDQFHS